MGGSWFDSACRMLCTVVSLAAFCFLAFHQMTAYRTENGLNKCYVLDGIEQPVIVIPNVGDADQTDVS